MSLQSLLSSCLNEGHRVRRLESNHRFFSLIISVLLPVEGLMPAGSFQSVKVCTESAHLSDTSANSGQRDQMGNKRCNCTALNQSQAEQEKNINYLLFFSVLSCIFIKCQVSLYKWDKAPQKLKLSMLYHIQFIRSMGQLPSI